MKRFARTVMIMLCMTISCSALAQSTARVDPIEAFRTHVMTDAELLSVYLADQPDPKAADTAKKGGDDLKAGVGAAIASAKDNQDLKAAIKAFYVAADAYFQSAFSFTGLPTYDPMLNRLVLTPQQIQLTATQSRLKADLDAKNAALKLEMQLAAN